MNSCCDLILVSGSGAFMCNITLILGLGTCLKKIRVQDGKGFKCLVYLYVLQGWSTDSCCFFWLMLVLVQLFVTELCLSLSSASDTGSGDVISEALLLFVPCSGGTMC